MGNPFIDKFFSKQQADAIRKLWEDKNSRLLLEQQIGSALLKSEDIVVDLPITQLMLISSLSPFASNSQECYRIAEIIHWGLYTLDILPLVTEHQGKQLAFRCLVSLSLFRKALEKKQKRYGAPNPSFYRGVGINSFRQIGFDKISSHFTQWESFINEMFVV